MTVTDLCELVMTQCNLDTDDLDEYKEEIVTYLNAGYDRLYKKYMCEHLTETQRLKTSSMSSSPSLPIHFHQAIADWATWMYYRNGNAAKQQRGMQFRNEFEIFLGEVPEGGGITDETKLAERADAMRWKNLY